MGSFSLGRGESPHLNLPPQGEEAQASSSRLDSYQYPPHPSLLPQGEKVQETRRCPMVTDTNTPNLNSYLREPDSTEADGPPGQATALARQESRQA